jgi:hypothetical protein
MQRTDVSRPREQLHAPTLQEMLEMDSEIDGGELQNFSVSIETGYFVFTDLLNTVYKVRCEASE